MPNGYAQLRIDGRSWLAHRAAYSIFVGNIPPGMLVCHKCDNRKCVEPSHLFVGTALDNNRDAKAKGRNSRGPEHAAKVNSTGRRQRRDLTDDQVRYILENRALKARVALAAECGVSSSAIQLILSGVTYRHITGGVKRTDKPARELKWQGGPRRRPRNEDVIRWEDLKRYGKFREVPGSPRWLKRHPLRVEPKWIDRDEDHEWSIDADGMTRRLPSPLQPTTWGELRQLLALLKMGKKSRESISR